MFRLLGNLDGLYMSQWLASLHFSILEILIAITGFLLASYAVIGNDVIQTLGTFIQSNEKQPWWKLFIYIGGILGLVLLVGWFINSGDATYGRLDKIARPEHLTFWYLIPPLLLLIITRYGIPVSTTFLILSIFSSQVVLEGMLIKSFGGYVLAFFSSFGIYQFFLYRFEQHDEEEDIKNKKLWIILQWCSTAFLWSQWLIQDFANIYIYLPAQLDFLSMMLSLFAMLIILAFILRLKGGAIQQVVSNKSNSSNIRSATFIDFIYGSVLLFFTTLNNVPMSTTWAFVGILAGREIALRNKVYIGTLRAGWKLIGVDFLKVTFGILVSVVVVLILKNTGRIG